jgi:hypothetical protein
MIEIMYKVGLKKECLKYLFKSHSMGLYFPLYGIDVCPHANIKNKLILQ